jgi:hypothetical protein
MAFSTPQKVVAEVKKYRRNRLKFAKTLSKLRTKARLTRYRLALEANTDPGHLGRLEGGQRCHPSRDLVLRLGQALLDNSGDITLQDVDQLLQAAGHGPIPRARISITSLLK